MTALTPAEIDAMEASWRLAVHSSGYAQASAWAIANGRKLIAAARHIGSVEGIEWLKTADIDRLQAAEVALAPFAKEGAHWRTEADTCIPDGDLVAEHVADGCGWLDDLTVGDLRRAAVAGGVPPDADPEVDDDEPCAVCGGPEGDGPPRGATHCIACDADWPNDEPDPDEEMDAFGVDQGPR